jgi:hypothetical protein
MAWTVLQQLLEVEVKKTRHRAKGLIPAGHGRRQGWGLCCRAVERVVEEERVEEERGAR